jgi:hypothetical protein
MKAAVGMQGEAKMRSYTVRQVVPDSHLLTVQLPPGAPTGPAQVIVLFDSEAPQSHPMPAVEAPSAQPTHGLADFMRWLDTQPATGRSAAEIQQQVDEERNVWD